MAVFVLTADGRGNNSASLIGIQKFFTQAEVSEGKGEENVSEGERFSGGRRNNSVPLMQAFDAR